jgi:alditol oxidase
VTGQTTKQTTGQTSEQTTGQATEQSGTKATNWAANIVFEASGRHDPGSVDDLQELVASTPRIRALGTAHSFNPIADTPGEQVSVAALPHRFDLDPDGSTVTVSAGLRYGDLATLLHEAGYAVPNLGSLPHISVAGAVATGTHGSGKTVGNLATAVSGLELVTADGNLMRISRAGDPETFPGAVVSLGALGVVTAVTLDVETTFDVRQWVYDDLPWSAADEHIEEIFASAYSVSLFTDWRSDVISQVWLKDRLDAPQQPQPPARWLGATLADGPRHPIPGMPVENSTEQLGVPGPWQSRLPHFRLEFTPSSGEELQTEYLLPREHAVEALAAVARIREHVGPLVQISEIRTIAADDLWLSPSYGRDTVGIHFTWVPDTAAVLPVLGMLEERLEPFEPRPHWGKLFTTGVDTLRRRYERYGDFTVLMRRFDPHGKFRNDLLDTWFPLDS